MKTWNNTEINSTNSGNVFVEIVLNGKTEPALKFLYHNNKENEKVYQKLLDIICYSTNYKFILTTPQYVKEIDYLDTLRWEIEWWTDCEMFQWMQ